MMTLYCPNVDDLVRSWDILLLPMPVPNLNHPIIQRSPCRPSISLWSPKTLRSSVRDVERRACPSSSNEVRHLGSVGFRVLQGHLVPAHDQTDRHGTENLTRQ